MNSKSLFSIIAILIAASIHAQEPSSNLDKINKTLPHHFKEIRTGATMEVVREKNYVRIYMLVDDIEQYDHILVERSDEQQQNFSQCKLIKIERGKYPNGYVELVDEYPVSSKMGNVYRIKTITSDDIMRMYPSVPITLEEAKKPVK